MASVLVRGGAAGFAQEIEAGRYRLVAEEPVETAGTDGGPPPYGLLPAALGTCTSMMNISMAARRKGWPLAGVTVRLQQARIHAQECAERLEIANRCPVRRALVSAIDIRTRLV